METKQFEELRNKLGRKENQKARIEGSIEQIQKQLKTDFDLEEDQVQQRLDDLNRDIEKEQMNLGELKVKLDSIIDWSLL